MNSYGLKVTTPYDKPEAKKIYNAFGDIVLTDSGSYEVHCISDTYINHNLINNILHITCISECDDIEISIKACGQTEGDQVADVYHKIIAKNKNVKANIECSGVAKDNSRIIYRSSLDARERASGVGKQDGEFLLLSTTAEVDTEPSLDISSKDFPTSHAIGVSGVSKLKTWYLLARGYSEKEAEREIVEGFLNR